MSEMMSANESSLRMMLIHSLEMGLRGETIAARQNRRTPLIEAALEPAHSRLSPASLKALSGALALVIGTEAMVVFKDVLQVSDAEAKRIRRWAIRALVERALKKPSRQA
jgi:hypothetical protein